MNKPRDCPEIETLASTKPAAVRNGGKYYFTGKPCKRRHLSVRYTASGCCYACHRLSVAVQSAKWQKANAGRAKEIQKQWRDGKRERYRELQRAYYARNKQARNKANAVWRRRNLEVVRAQKRRRYIGERRALAPWANKDAILAIYRRAAALRRLTGIDYQVDHVVPLFGKNVSGLHVETNLQIMTGDANRRKHARWSD